MRAPSGKCPQVREAKSEHRDLAHPITSQSREYIQKKVLEAYEAEKAKTSSVT